MTYKRLPILVETSISRVDMLRIELAGEFDSKIKVDIAKTESAITCSAGCSWCCYHPVSISVLEGILIYRWLVKKGKWTSKLKENLKISADKQFGLSYEVWLKVLIPCPLLGDDKKCSIYPARPLICRVYYATSDPHYCHPHRISGKHTKLLPRESAVEPFHEKQEEILRKHKLQLLTMPIGAALLMAEKVCTEKIDLDTVDVLILKEYGDLA